MAERHLRLVAAKQAVREVEERVGRVAERQVDRRAETKTDPKNTRQPTAIEFAIAVVSSRSLPERKLRERLASRFDAAEVDEAMARMRELRLVDDAAWAEQFARDRFERNGKGRHRIRNELVAKGIDRASVAAAMAAVFGGSDGGQAGHDAEREMAVAMLETLRSKLARAASGDAENLKNRLFRRMLARGYPASLVRDLLDVS